MIALGGGAGEDHASATSRTNNSRGFPGRDPCDAEPMSIAHHVTMRLAESRWIARQPSEVRRVARLMYRIGNGGGLLAFCLADTHLHCLAEGTRAEAGALARRLEIGTKTLRLEVRFEPARTRPVNGLDHLQNALFYLFRQGTHHGTRFDPCMEGRPHRREAVQRLAELSRARPRLARGTTDV